MSSPLIVCGASARAAAFSARRAGFSPYAIDLFADRDLAAIGPSVKIDRYPAGFLPALAAAPAAPWIYTGGLENYPRLVERMAKLRPLWGNRGEVLRSIRDPRQLATILARHGLAYPEINPTDLVERDWLLKPRRGSAGLGIRRVAAGDSPTAGPKHFVQEYIPGRSISAVFVAARGQAVLLGTSRQLIGRDWGLSPEFLYLGSIGPLGLTDSESAKLTKLGNVLAAEFQLVGLFNIDLIQTEGELWTVEVNPRYSASVEVLERASGTSFVAMHAAACQSGELPRTTLSYAGECVGKAVVYVDRPCRWSESLNAVIRRVNMSGDLPSIADIPQLGQGFDACQPVVTVFAEGASPDQVEQRLKTSSVEILNRLDEPRG